MNREGFYACELDLSTLPLLCEPHGLFCSSIWVPNGLLLSSSSTNSYLVFLLGRDLRIWRHTILSKDIMKACIIGSSY